MFFELFIDLKENRANKDHHCADNEMGKNSKSTQDAAKMGAILEGDRKYLSWILAVILIFTLVIVLKSFAYF